MIAAALPFNMPAPERRSGVGAGVIIDKSGIILTNNHVVEGATEVTVRLSDGREFEGYDIKTDKHPTWPSCTSRAPATCPPPRWVTPTSYRDRRLGDRRRQSVQSRADRQRRHHQRQGTHAALRTSAPSTCRPMPRSIPATRAVRWWTSTAK